jgi:hypothetical protein
MNNHFNLILQIRIGLSQLNCSYLDFAKGNLRQIFMKLYLFLIETGSRCMSGQEPELRSLLRFRADQRAVAPPYSELQSYCRL